MAKYGNILTVFNADQQTKDYIGNLLSNNQADFVLFNEIYFIETNSKKNTGDIIKELNNLQVDFLFYHNNISDGSQIKSKGISPIVINAIDRILFN